MVRLYDTAVGAAALAISTASRNFFELLSDLPTDDNNSSSEEEDDGIIIEEESDNNLQKEEAKREQQQEIQQRSGTKSSTRRRRRGSPRNPDFTAPRLRDFDPEVVHKGQLEQIAMMQALPKEDLAIHEGWMQEAISMAKEALANDETPVGCVFVHDNKIIGRGYNYTNKTLNGTRHAEFVALAQILQDHPPEILRETDLYVTVEPCIMCASALRQFGIRAVFFGCFNDRFGGNGGVLRIHEDDNVDPGYPAYPDIFRAEAIMLLRQFYIQENEKAPEPKQKKTRELKTEIIPLDLTKHRDKIATPPVLSRTNTPAQPQTQSTPFRAAM